MVKRFFARMLFRTTGEFHNPLMHPFLLITATMGVSFVFFHGTLPVESSVLFQLTIGHLPDISASIWGVGALALSVIHLVAIQVRVPWLGKLTTMTGVLLWLYATILYGLFGFWLQVLTSGIPNLWFWVWYYFFVETYHEDKVKSP
jgi:hypothetical protein